MSYTGLKYVNELGGIHAERIEDGVFEYFAPGSANHGRALSGEWGGIEAYVPPAPLTPGQLDAIADQLADQILQQNRDALRALGETLAEVIWRVSNGTVPQNITEQQARTWVRDTFRAKYRALL